MSNINGSESQKGIVKEEKRERGRETSIWKEKIKNGNSDPQFNTTEYLIFIKRIIAPKR